MSRYKKNEKILISAEMYMSCWIPREMYEEILEAAEYDEGECDSVNLNKAETRYIFNHGWLDGDGYITSDEIKDIENSQKTDWEKYEIEDEKHLDTIIQENLKKLRNIIGSENRIRVGNQGSYHDYVIFVDEDLYSNFLTDTEAKSEILCLLTGIDLGARKKENKA